ncbi:hypothetical protein ABZ419_29805 [Streptomyces cinnamoneus]
MLVAASAAGASALFRIPRPPPGRARVSYVVVHTDGWWSVSADTTVTTVA